MNTAKEHYDRHLAKFYSWMLGDFAQKSDEQLEFFSRNQIVANSAATALDLGCGNGIQSIALAKLGFAVKAIDFSDQLLHELKTNRGNLDIEIVKADILEMDFNRFRPEIIVCMGDTLTHFPNKGTVLRLVELTSRVLPENGKIVFSFRDLRQVRTGTDRFFMVKADENRIHTCFLEHLDEHVVVHDILHEKTESWKMSVSAYTKIKLGTDELRGMLEDHGMAVVAEETINGMVYMIARKTEAASLVN